MTQKNYINILGKILIIFIFFLFCYFRLKSLFYQTVPYTYDQGRDFIKALEIIAYQKPTLIGPTTGIAGLFHGVWWYYLLTIPFIVFRGWPLGFYYFVFFIFLLSFIIFFLFLKKYFDYLTAIIISFLIVLSQYFIFKSTFAGNNIIVIPLVMYFSMVNFLLIEDKVKTNQFLWLFAVGLLLGLISEFEFSFGIFLIPTYLIVIFLFKNIRIYFLKIKNLAAFISGLLVAFLPRIFFEIRHDFLQTKTLVSFFIKPHLYTVRPYVDSLKERINLFIDYFNGIFPNDYFAYLFLLIIIGFLIIAYVKKIKIHHQALRLFTTMIFLLFLFSTFYKDTFWTNYYEGIHYLFIMIIAISLSVKPKRSTSFLNWIKIGLISVLFLFGSQKLLTEISSKPEVNGLVVQEKVVNYILSKQLNNEFCVKIYTPPVIPYTYDYLFTYNHLFKKYPSPNKYWVNNRCWFIIENDDYKERQKTWVKNNVPEKSKKIFKVLIKDVKIALYEKNHE